MSPESGGTVRDWLSQYEFLADHCGDRMVLKLTVDQAIQVLLGTPEARSAMRTALAEAEQSAEKSYLVQLAEYVVNNHGIAEATKLAREVLDRECGPCSSSWHEVKCRWWKGHVGAHEGRVSERWASWKDEDATPHTGRGVPS